MLPVLAAIAIAAPAIQDPPRLRTVLENNAVILVEPMPKEPVISVQLFASARYIPETEATHGYRHLLEHVLMRGDGSLDRKLESQACFMKAATLRDAMQIDLTVGPNQLQLGLDTLATLLRKPSFTQDRLDRELRVMRNEFAMVDSPMALSSAAWKCAYGEAGLDPMGTFDSIYRATPEKLTEVFDRQFAAEGLALVIAGPVNLDKATQMAKALLAPRPKSKFAVPDLKRAGKAGRETAESSGEARGAIVPSFKMPQTVAALAASLAISSELAGCFVIYTPSDRAGLVLIGRTESSSGLGAFIDSLQRPADLYPRGRAMARQWVERQLQTPQGVGFLRGLLLCQGQSNRPEMMLQALDAMTQKQFEEGVQALTAGTAAVSVGAR